MQVLKEIWDFLQNEILGMNWLNELVDSGLSALGLDLAPALVVDGKVVSYGKILKTEEVIKILQS